MTFADQRLAAVGADVDAWHVGHARDVLALVEGSPAHERQAYLLRHASRPVLSCVIRLAVGQTPGEELSGDSEWAASAALARREVLAYRSAGLDVGTVDRSLRLLDWVDSQIASWPEPDWSLAVRSRVDELVDAGRRGRQRGEQLRRDRKPDPSTRAVVDAGWLLRHPADHYFCKARATATDCWLCEWLDELISSYAPSYEALAIQDWSVCEDRAQLVLELQLHDPMPGSWNDPALTNVLTAHRGSAAVGTELRLRQVADPDEPFNGTLVSLLAGESWLVCASQHADGSLIPADGTRRTTLNRPRVAGVS